MSRRGQLFRSMSLQQLIGISFTACVLLLALASSLVISKQSGDTVERRLQHEGMQLVESLARQSTLALLYEDEGSAAEVAKSFQGFPDVHGKSCQDHIDTPMAESPSGPQADDSAQPP